MKSKDQLLLEEAYQSIYESALEPSYFGPKEDKERWLWWLNLYNHEVHSDGSISILTSVYINKRNLVRLPFNFREVQGSFECSMNRLETLEGSPEITMHDFDCSYNNLTSLVGAPKKVGFTFDCSHNEIKTLEGAPEEIGKTFSSDKFSDQDYRNFVKLRNVSRKLSPDLDVDLEDFS